MEENKKLENPRAFPLPIPYEHFTNRSAGMTLRDYFAAKALPQVMNQYNGEGKDVYDFHGEELEAIAFYSYEIADAMLKQRNK